MTRMTTVTMVALIALSGCGKSDPSQEAQKTADVITGDAKGSASDNPICKKFSAEEIAASIGEPVKAGENAAMGMGCSWAAQDGDGQVIVASVPAEYEERASAAEGFREVPDAGKHGFVVPDMGGWVAGAVSGKSFVKVSVAGNKASDANALALLKEAIKRQP